MQVVRVDELVKDQRPPISAFTRVFDALWAAALRAVLDKLINTNRNAVQAIKAAFWAVLFSCHHPPSRMMTKSRIANDRRDLGREQLDHPGHVRERQAADVDLRQETLVAEQLALIKDLVDDLLRAADENRAMRGGAFLIIGPRNLLGAILRWRVGEKVAGIVRIK